MFTEVLRTIIASAFFAAYTRTIHIEKNASGCHAFFRCFEFDMENVGGLFSMLASWAEMLWAVYPVNEFDFRSIFYYYYAIRRTSQRNAYCSD